jgi:nicotinamidase-related amidase
MKFECDKEPNSIKNQPTDWPPIEFLKREGKYSEFSRIKIPISDEDRQKLTIDESIEPLPQDFVITTGEDLHRLLRAKKILHLFYAGFYVNMCIQYRDYGLRAMEERGYNIILLRDCTTAIEAHDTVDNLIITELSIRHIEMLHGFTTISKDFIEACRNVT